MQPVCYHGQRNTLVSDRPKNTFPLFPLEPSLFSLKTTASTPHLAFKSAIFKGIKKEDEEQSFPISTQT